MESLVFGSCDTQFALELSDQLGGSDNLFRLHTPETITDQLSPSFIVFPAGNRQFPGELIRALRLAGSTGERAFLFRSDSLQSDFCLVERRDGGLQISPGSR